MARPKISDEVVIVNIDGTDIKLLKDKLLEYMPLLAKGRKRRYSKMLNADKLRRFRRYQTKEARLYQNWYVWTVGMENVYFGTRYAFRRLRKKFKEDNLGELKLTQLDILMCMRMYMAVHGVNYIRQQPFAIWANENGYLSFSIRMQQYRSMKFTELANEHYVNMDGNRVFLTMRAQMVFRELNKGFRDFFGNPQDSGGKYGEVPVDPMEPK